MYYEGGQSNDQELQCKYQDQVLEMLPEFLYQNHLDKKSIEKLIGTIFFNETDFKVIFEKNIFRFNLRFFRYSIFRVVFSLRKRKH